MTDETAGMLGAIIFLGIYWIILLFPTIFGIISFFGKKRKPKFGIFLCALGLLFLAVSVYNLALVSGSDPQAIKGTDGIGAGAFFLFFVLGALNIALGVTLFRRQA